MTGLAEAVRLLRVFHDLKQRQMAESLGISTAYLSQLESAKKSPNVETLLRYSESLKTPLSSIFFLAEKIGLKDYSYPAENPISRKVLRILDWLAEKAEEPPQERSAQEEKPRRPATPRKDISKENGINSARSKGRRTA